MSRSEYIMMYRSEEKLWWYIGLRYMLKYCLAKHAPANAYMLDAGCGTGKNIEFLTSVGYKVEGFDYSADAVDYCIRRGLNQVKQGDITAIAYPDEVFDVVYCMDVLGLLNEKGRTNAVKEMYRVLKPGGIILCHSAALELFRSQHDVVTNLKLRFNKQQIKDLFGLNNVTVLKLSYRVFLLSPLVLVFKLAKRITGAFKKEEESNSDQVIFPLGINWMLLQVQLLENWLFRKINFPFGSSVFIMIRKG